MRRININLTWTNIVYIQCDILISVTSRNFVVKSWSQKQNHKRKRKREEKDKFTIQKDKEINKKKSNFLKRLNERY